MSEDGETVCVQLPRGRRIFRTHVVKPVVSGEQDTVVNSIDFSADEKKLPEYFQPSRKKYLNGLMKKRKALTVVNRNVVPEGERICKTRFVDHVKKLNDGTYLSKSRLVGMNYNDIESGSVATKAPTLKRVCHCLILCASALNRTTGHKKKISVSYTHLTLPTILLV